MKYTLEQDEIHLLIEIDMAESPREVFLDIACLPDPLSLTTGEYRGLEYSRGFVLNRGTGANLNTRVESVYLRDANVRKDFFSVNQGYFFNSASKMRIKVVFYAL
jgi:hypothetical protein